MGAIYRPKYKAADGTIKESAVWWVRYRQHCKTERQSTETTDERKARAFLDPVLGGTVPDGARWDPARRAW